jgi:diguanylate cyclase (GGDEF)-like protein
MNGVPYLYVNISALCCYFLLLTAFIAVKKTPTIHHFIVVLLGFTIWTGASVLMRLEIAPGVPFWFTISIMALFSLGFIIYLFVCSFTNKRHPILTFVWALGTIVMLFFTALGYFLSPPNIVETAQGKLFQYDMTWHIAIPYVFLMMIVASMWKIILQTVRENGVRTPGLRAIIFGCIIIGIGNIIQILPGNVFPWDTLSGIVFLCAFVTAMYRKRMFKMTLLVSKNVMLAAVYIVCLAILISFLSPIQGLLGRFLPDDNTVLIASIVVIFSVLLFLVYLISKKLMAVLFVTEEYQNRLITDFSEKASRSLNTDEIVKTLVSAITTGGIGNSNVYICLLEGNYYIPKASSNSLNPLFFTLSKDSPCVTTLKHSEEYLIVEEFRHTTLYRSMWDAEKQVLKDLDLGCIVAMRDGDKIIGLILLSNKERGTAYTYSDVSFLSTLASIASIAIKNAGLYEQMYKEARIDNLTGVYNYRAFVEKVGTDYRLYGKECLSLLNIDIDDFKLYNQLYGTLEGDRMLQRIAEILMHNVGESGTVFRLGGKVFSVLLPLFDGRRSSMLATQIQKQVADINMAPGRTAYKPITLSIGICISPMAASSAKELIENSDLAVYTAKSGGKDRVVLYQSSDKGHKSLARKVEEAIGNTELATDASSSILSALTAAIDAKDHYTFQHSINVARYAAILAAAIDLSDYEISIAYQAGLMHDIGKISIPESILTKNASLTSDEYQVIMGHVLSSIEIIKHLPAMDYLIPAAIAHHERWDGKGYPRGISGEEIPITARCLAIADAFDAMTTQRAYRDKLSVEYACNQLLECAGTQFDPVLAQKFVDLVRAGEIIPTNDSPNGHPAPVLFDKAE